MDNIEFHLILHYEVSTLINHTLKIETIETKRTLVI